MKKIIFLAIALLLLFNFSFASNDPTEENNSKVANVITKVFQFSASSSEQLIEGTVLINLSVDENGIITVNQINSDREDLKKYVINELNNIIIDDLTYVPDQTYDMKIVFKML